MVTPVPNSTVQRLPRVELEVRPQPSEDELAALREALQPGAGLPSAYESPWRQAALREAADVGELRP